MLPSRLPLNVLLVDDDVSIRKVMARMLHIRFHVDVVECGNGLEALAALSTDRFSLMLLDLEMPRLDGVQVLQAIRESPSLRDLPVVVMTGRDEADTVRRVVGFGVAGYIVKPVLPGELHERLAGLIASIRSQAQSVRPAASGFQPLTLTPQTRVMIADGHADFRQFFSNTVGHLCEVEECASGLTALQRCQQDPPYAIFVGSDLGVIKREMLVSNLGNSEIRVIGIQQPRLGLRPKKGSWYEALIGRSFVPAVFMEGFKSLLVRRGPMAELQTSIPDLKLLGIAAAEEAISATLRAPLVLRPGKVRSTLGRGWSSAMALDIGSEHCDPMPLTLHLSMPDRCVSLLVERCIALGIDEPNEPDHLLCPLVERVGGLLGRDLEGRGLTVTEATAVAPLGLSQRLHGEHNEGDVIALAFDVQGTGISFWLEIGSRDDTVTSLTAVA